MHDVAMSVRRLRLRRLTSATFQMTINNLKITNNNL